ncbi:reverse transcriptase-like protein [Sphingomonas sp. LY160]|uniref:reverse transcriptase-like protein n=1 Tax=Sphingomonas sp. LY160 TaxID=3095342 RepID=UPI002ADEF4DD|nr:reverse transcriptase-like protein [Sphingomonas sp. LY160]MEA1071854.1 reverse transcriptase-like protein [Sphingomonas sp. LY160]
MHEAEVKRRKVYFDGGFRGGEMEIAVVVGGEAFVVRNLGNGDRLKAEWLALLYGISVARFLRLDDIILLGDALDVVDQAGGRAPVTSSCKEQAGALEALREGHLPPIRHIKRTQNLAGIALASAHPR